jgi:hypothetical protein
MSYLLEQCILHSYRDTTTIRIMTLLITTLLIMPIHITLNTGDITTLLIMPIHITLNTGDITYNDMAYNINKCNIAYLFLSTVISKVI